MEIGIIGAGAVGAALADAFVRVGHHVRIGVRDPAGHDRHGAEVTTAPAAADEADLVVLAVPSDALPELLDTLSFAPGSVVVDATNAVGREPPGGEATVGAFVRSVVPDEVGVVKAFNTIGAEHMRNGHVGGHPAFLPVAGDPGALDRVVALAHEVGFDPVPLGGMDAVALVEEHARLWIHLMRTGWGRNFGFAVVGDPLRVAGT